MKQTRREFVRTLFVATQATVIGSVLPSRLFAEEVAGSGTLNFLVFGDWGRNGEKDQLDVAREMGLVAKDINAQFIMAVGDNFYEDGVAGVDDPQWQSSFENVYTAASLQVPWYAILGNHDYRQNAEAQIEYSRKSRRWNMPARYFTRTEKIGDAGAAEFFYIDTMPMAAKSGKLDPGNHHAGRQDVPKQVAWLEAALAASTAPWKIMVGHHPVYSGGEHGDTPFIVEHILPLMVKYGVQVYFNGHDHDLQHLQAGKVNLFCSGAGSKVRPTGMNSHSKFAKSCSGFTAVALGADKMDVRMIDDTGKLVYSVAVPRTV